MQSYPQADRPPPPMSVPRGGPWSHSVFMDLGFGDVLGRILWAGFDPSAVSACLSHADPRVCPMLDHGPLQGPWSDADYSPHDSAPFRACRTCPRISPNTQYIYCFPITLFSYILCIHRREIMESPHRRRGVSLSPQDGELSPTRHVC